MSTPTPPDAPTVAVELERLSGRVDTRFAQVNGELILLGQRNSQTERQLTDHEQRLAALERGRWPLPHVLALVAVATLALTLWQLAIR